MGRVVIRELRVAGFRGLRSLTAPLRLGPVNVVTGLNGAGKTAVLEAIYLAAMPYGAFPIPPYRSSALQVLADLRGGARNLIHVLSNHATIEYVLAEEVRVKLRRGEASGNTLRITLSRDGGVETYLSGTRVRAGDYPNLLAALGAGIEPPILALYIPNDTTAYTLIARYLTTKEAWEEILAEGLHERVAKELLGEAGIREYSEVTLSKEGIALRKKGTKETPPTHEPLTTLSEGIKRATLTYLATQTLKPRILLWDDPDTATHPNLLKAIIKWLTKLNTQTIITTNNPQTIQQAMEASHNQAKTITLTKNSKDNTTPTETN